MKISENKEDVAKKSKKKGNHSGMLIGHPIAIMYLLVRKITAEYAVNFPVWLRSCS